MKLPECNVRERLATFNQLKIFLYTLAAEYAPLFGSLFDFLEPKMYPHRAELNEKSSLPNHMEVKRKWQLQFVAQTKYLGSMANHKKWQVFLDYQRESPEDLTCCAKGLRRLVVFGGMKFFHTESAPFSESYWVLASGDWPHMSVGLGLYLAREYPEAEANSLEDIKELIRHDDLERFYEEGAFMMWG